MKKFKKFSPGTLRFSVRNLPSKRYTVRQYGFVYNHHSTHPGGGGLTLGVIILDSKTEIKLLLSSQCTVGTSV